MIILSDITEQHKDYVCVQPEHDRDYGDEPAVAGYGNHKPDHYALSVSVFEKGIGHARVILTLEQAIDLRKALAQEIQGLIA